MRENDTALIRAMDIPVALVLLTRLPLPALPAAAFERQAAATWAFPLVGLVVGALAAAAGYLALAVGFPAAIAAGLCLTVQIIATGAMHEDGLADVADGFWGGWTVEQRLDIMKDSQVGTYGVLALILSTGLRWVALSVVLPASFWTVVAVAILSRAALPFVMLMPRARPGGLSDRVGQPPVLAAAVSAILAIIILVIMAGAATVPLALAAILAVAFCAINARTKIGGQTGDVLGATQQITEIAGLVALLLML